MKYYKFLICFLILNSFLSLVVVSNYDHSHDHGGGGFTGGGSGNKDGNNPSNLNTNPDKTGSFPTEGIDHTFLSNKNPPTGSINKKPTNTQGNNNPTNIQGGNNPTITQGVNNPKNVQSDTKSTNANPTIIQIPKKAINNQNDNDTFTSNTIATNTISGTSSVTSITFPTPISLSSGGITLYIGCIYICKMIGATLFIMFVSGIIMLHH